ncbi:mannosyl-glycoprotein endo-beta-N-acetylglucosamidase [Campylobacter coli]|nr:mannosyl-glycoprotein endo-beta-N-acetylglucosamidase [Campylobacter coli]
MKRIIIFLSFYLLPLFGNSELKNGFGEEYYKLNVEQKRQIFFTKMNTMFDKSFEEIAKERAFVEAFFYDAYKMGIAQALVESAMGTSRFAREANNLFGEWTWGEKGLIPDLRYPDKKHKIRIFDSLQDSVDSYVLNLNRHFAYEEFRNERAKFESEGKEITGLEAIKTLDSYSERKGYYINIVTKIIQRYDLERYDTPKSF